MITYSELYNEGCALLKSASIPEAALDSRLLLEFICGTDRNTLLAHPDEPVSEIHERQYRRVLAERADHIPLQHITGMQEFMGLEFAVTKDVLVPRLDTEFVVEEVLRFTQDGMKILDLCTGSGCILISIMNYKNGIYGVGTDISEKALNAARENAGRNGIEADFRQGDLFDALSGDKTLFDIIVSNPPYIRRDEIASLAPEVKDHDPLIALDGGCDGLDFYRKITQKAGEHLTNYGLLFFEIGYDQKEEVQKILEDAGFTDVTVLKDYSGNDRVAYGKYVKH